MSQFIPLQHFDLKLDGVSCMGCVSSIESALHEADPQSHLRVIALEAQVFSVTTALDEPKIRQMVHDLGFDVVTCSAAV